MYTKATISAEVKEHLIIEAATRLATEDCEDVQEHLDTIAEWPLNNNLFEAAAKRIGLNNLKSRRTHPAPENVSEQPRGEIKPINVKLMALQDQFEAEYDSRTAKYWVTKDTLAETAATLEEKFPGGNLEALNAFLKKHKKRAIDYIDLAFIYLAHKHNVEKNPDGGSPFTGIVGLAKPIKRAGLIAHLPENLQISAAINVFMGLGLTERVTVQEKGKAATYKMTANF